MNWVNGREMGGEKRAGGGQGQLLQEGVETDLQIMRMLDTLADIRINESITHD